MTEKQSNCLNCGKPLKSGRIDKKYCDDGCRIQYHNDQNIVEKKETKKINGILRNNRKILKKLLDNNPFVVVLYEDLLKKGFEFDYHTHYVNSHYQNNKYTFCYNYGYRPVEKNKYKIIKGFK